MTRTITNPGFDPKDPAETIIVGFEFAALTASPTSPVVTATRHAGEEDEDPSAILSGSPTISGTRILQKIVAGTAGTDYLLRCEVDGESATHYALSGILPVRTA